MIPINDIITAVCARAFSGDTKSVYFSNIQLEIERETGGPVGAGFLANAIESLGYTVDDSFKPWVVRT